MKKVNISEDKLKKALREIFKEEILNNDEPNAATPRDPFGQDALERKGTPYENREDGHGESIVGKPVDPTIYQPNQELNRYGVKGNGMT